MQHCTLWLKFTKLEFQLYINNNPNINFLYFRETPPDCKTYLLIDDGKCDLINFNEECKYDGKDCCPNYHGIGNGQCESENIIKMCNYDGGDCCEPEKVNDGICDIGNLNRMCDFDGELNDCSCDYKNLTKDGYCNPANNKSNCLFDNYDCLCKFHQSDLCLKCC